MNYSRSWKQEQRRQHETAALRAMYWALTALLIGSALALLLAGTAWAEDLPSHPTLALALVNAGRRPPSSPTRGEDVNTWTTLDTTLQATYTGLLIMDWKQTQYIARHPDAYWETATALSRHPSISSVSTYFAAQWLVHTAVAYLLKKPYRTIWQCVFLGIEYDAVGHNYAAGIRVSF